MTRATTEQIQGVFWLRAQIIHLGTPQLSDQLGKWLDL